MKNVSNSAAGQKPHMGRLTSHVIAMREPNNNPAVPLSYVYVTTIENQIWQRAFPASCRLQTVEGAEERN